MPARITRGLKVAWCSLQATWGGVIDCRSTFSATNSPSSWTPSGPTRSIFVFAFRIALSDAFRRTGTMSNATSNSLVFQAVRLTPPKGKGRRPMTILLINGRKSCWVLWDGQYSTSTKFLARIIRSHDSLNELNSLFPEGQYNGWASIPKATIDQMCFKESNSCTPTSVMWPISRITPFLSAFNFHRHPSLRTFSDHHEPSQIEANCDMATLLTFPLELRLKILEFAIVDKEIFVCFDQLCIHNRLYSPFAPVNRNIGLLLTCQQLNREVNSFTLPKLKLRCCSYDTAKKYLALYRPRINHLEYMRVSTKILFPPDTDSWLKTLQRTTCMQTRRAFHGMKFVEIEDLQERVDECVRLIIRYEPCVSARVEDGNGYWKLASRHASDALWEGKYSRAETSYAEWRRMLSSSRFEIEMIYNHYNSFDASKSSCLLQTMSSAWVRLPSRRKLALASLTWPDATTFPSLLHISFLLTTLITVQRLSGTHHRLYHGSTPFATLASRL